MHESSLRIVLSSAYEQKQANFRVLIDNKQNEDMDTTKDNFVFLLRCRMTLTKPSYRAASFFVTTTVSPDAIGYKHVKESLAHHTPFRAHT